jgi:hypothetical protein
MMKKEHEKDNPVGKWISSKIFSMNSTNHYYNSWRKMGKYTRLNHIDCQ